MLVLAGIGVVAVIPTVPVVFTGTDTTGVVASRPELPMPPPPLFGYTPLGDR